MKTEFELSIALILCASVHLWLIPRSLPCDTTSHGGPSCATCRSASAASPWRACSASAAEQRGADPLAPKPPHFKAKAKNVIVLHMTGAPPHLDMFDYKPELVKRTGEPCPDSLIKGKQFAFTSGVPKLLGTPQKFSPARQERRVGLRRAAGHRLDRRRPLLRQVDVHRAVQPRPGRAAALHRLGPAGPAEHGLVGDLRPRLREQGPARLHRPRLAAACCPARARRPGATASCRASTRACSAAPAATRCCTSATPRAWTARRAASASTPCSDLNEMQATELGHPETATRIAQYEMAFRMQTAVPEVMDIGKESKQTLADYGAAPGAASFANNCLLARRLVEKGVRFVHLFDWGWDFHGTNPGEDINTGLPKRCAPMDRAVAALIKDLKNRGMLDETLVVWTGEFGRTPFREGRTAGSKNLGRDHHPYSYTMFMAGGGIKPGVSHGATDDLGFYAVDKQDPRPRLAGDDPAPAGHGPRAADVPLPGPRLPADGRAWEGGQGDCWRRRNAFALAQRRGVSPPVEAQPGRSTASRDGCR